MARRRPLTIAYTPDSDDAFYYDALESGRVRLPGFRPRFRREPMSVLNRAALRRPLRRHRHLLRRLPARRRAVRHPQRRHQRRPRLRAGAGQQDDRTQAADLRGRRVGVPGVPTTGWFLLRCLCPEAVPVEMPFDRIGDAVAAGELDAGVMIHEELLYYPQLGLRRVVDLGAEWCQRNGLPLPVGLNVVRRDLGRAGHGADLRRASAAACSTPWHHRDEALAWVSRFGRGAEGQCTAQFVEMFANADSRAHAGRRPPCALACCSCQVARPGAGRRRAAARHHRGDAARSRPRPASVA